MNHSTKGLEMTSVERSLGETQYWVRQRIMKAFTVRLTVGDVVVSIIPTCAIFFALWFVGLEGSSFRYFPFPFVPFGIVGLPMVSVVVISLVHKARPRADLLNWFQSIFDPKVYAARKSREA
jgi:hypothetical protein